MQFLFLFTVRILNYKSVTRNPAFIFIYCKNTALQVFESYPAHKKGTLIDTKELVMFKMIMLLGQKKTIQNA